MATIFTVRRKTTEEWNAYRYKIAEGEVTLDSTIWRLKVGDGDRKWSELPYVDVQVIDDCETEDKNNALSANQGKKLLELINAKADSTTVNNLETKLTQLINNSKVTIINELKPTNKITDALSAYQGYYLKTLIDKKADSENINSFIEIILKNYSSEDWTFTLENGNTVTKKVVLTSSDIKAGNYTPESWSFVLENGNTVTKKVVLSS